MVKNFRYKNKSVGIMVGTISTLVNFLLFILKFWAGLVTGSIAIMADAWHTLSDSISSLIVIFGFKIASKPPDEKHEFGHGRAEIIAAVIIGILVALVAFNFIYQGIIKLREHDSTTYGTIGFIAIIISLAVKEGMAQYSFFMGKKLESGSLKADAWHHRSDALSSVVLLAGMVLGGSYWWIDGVIAIVIAMLILAASYNIIKQSVDPLLGESPEEDIVSEIVKIASEVYGGEINLHHFHVHRYGGHTELTFHLGLPGDMSLYESHLIADKIEEIVRKMLDIEPTIHIDPLKNLKNLKIHKNIEGGNDNGN